MNIKVNILVFLFAVQAIAAQLPPGGTSIGPESLSAVTAEAALTNGTFAIVDLPGVPGAQALEITSRVEGNDWDYQVYVRSTQPVKEGDVLLVSFKARTIKVPPMRGGSYVKASIEFPDWWALPEKEQESHTPLLQSLMVSSEEAWQDFAFPARATRDFKPGELWLALRAGMQEQTVQFAEITLMNYGPGVDAATLPSSRITYPGRAPDAPWRAAAHERIRQLRTRELEVVVVDGKGRPVDGAEVDIELERHAFEFGVAFHAKQLFKEFNPDYEHYRAVISKNFHGGSFVNALKWQAWCGDWAQEGFTPELALNALRWAKQENLPIRGHNLVWPRKMSIASNLLHLVEAEIPDCDKIQQTIFAHIKDIGEATSFWVREWDLLNEPIPCRDLQDLCGDQVMAEWFIKTKAMFPDLRLAINEYGILSSVTDGFKVGRYHDLIAELLAAGAPIDVLGFQGHFKAKDGIPSPERILQLLDRFAKFGKSMRVTEFDVLSNDPELIRDVFRDVYTVMFSHPQVTGLQIWEWEEVFHPDGSLTPAGEMHRRLVWNDWFTKSSGSTSTDGRYGVPAYLGTYLLRARMGDRKTEQRIVLPKGDEPYQVTLELP